MQTSSAIRPTSKARPQAALFLISIVAVAPWLVPAIAAAPLPVAGAMLDPPRADASAVWTGQAAYVFGGSPATSQDTDQVVAYDPAADSLTVQGAKLKRSYMAAVWTGAEVFLFGGCNHHDNCQGQLTAQVVRYDPVTDTLQPMGGTLPGARRQASAVWTGTHAYIFGGDQNGCDGCLGHTDAIVRYDPATDTAINVGSLPAGLCCTSAVWDGSFAYVFGGHTTSSIYDKVVRFDPATNLSQVVATLPTGRYFTSAVWTGSEALLFGGWNGTFNNQVVSFDPATNAVAVRASTLPTGRYATTAVWDGDTTAFVFGGFDGKRLGEIVKYRPVPTASIAPIPQAECIAGRGEVTLDGSGSSDVDGDALTFHWSAPGATFTDPDAVVTKGSFLLGTTTVTLTASDGRYSNEATASVVVTDTLPPAVQLSRPAPGESYVLDQTVPHRIPLLPVVAVGPLTAQADAVDLCGVAKVTFTASGGNALATATLSGDDAAAPYAFTYNPPVAASGLWTVVAAATDLGGNTSPPDSVDLVHVGTAIG